MSPQTTSPGPPATPDNAIQSGHIRLVHGVPHPASNRVAIIEPHTRLAPAAIKGSLYVLIDPGADRESNDYAVQQIAHTIQQTFYANTSSSSLSALRAAIRMANKMLYHANIKVAADQRVTVGVTCVVVKERELSIVQVAPAQVLLFSQAGLVRLPDMSPHPPRTLAMLGSSLFIEPDIYHRKLPAHPLTLLACTSTLAHHLPHSQAAALLQSHTPETITQALATLCQQHAIPQAHALVVTHAPAYDEHVPAQPPATPPAIGTWFAQLHNGQQPHQLAHNTASATVGALAPSSPPAAPTAAPPRDSLILGERRAPPDSLRRTRPAMVETAVLHRLILPFSRLRMALANHTTGPALAPISSESAGRTSRAYSRSRGKASEGPPAFSWSLLLSFILMVVVLMIYGQSLSQQHSDERDHYYVNQARSYLDSIPAAPDRASAIQLLDHADEALNQVRASALLTTTHPQLWTAFHEVESAYEQSAATLYRLSFIEPPEVLATHPRSDGTFDSMIVPPPTTELTDSASLQALRSLYVLDTTAHPTTLYRVPREGGAAQPFLQTGDLAQNTQVGRLLGLVWHNHNIALVEQDETTSNLGFYQRTGESWSYLRLGESAIGPLQSRLDAEVYNDNLYLWNTSTREILKYRSDNYSNIPWPWLSQSGRSHPDLSAAVDMAIDGHIYLLLPNGHILLFHTGQFKHEIVPGSITPPIAQAARIAVPTTPDNAYLFLLDPPNQRILQLDTERGTLVQQIVVRPDSPVRFDGLRAIAVDTSSGRTMIYLSNRHQILRFPLPRPPDAAR
jgi:hypothetical protein